MILRKISEHFQAIQYWVKILDFLQIFEIKKKTK